MVAFEKFTESQIIKRIITGEKELYEIIVRRFNPHLYKVGRSYNYDHEDTQDLMQETLIDAYKHLAKFEGRSDFKTWIIRIMMNHCYRRSRKLRVRNEIRRAVNDNSIPMFANNSNDTDKLLQNRELKLIIENALGKIPFDYRMVFALREMNGLNVSETASVLNVTEVNVKVRLNRAKAMLRNELERTYAANELFGFNLIYCDTMVEKVMKKINEL